MSWKFDHTDHAQFTLVWIGPEGDVDDSCSAIVPRGESGGR